jgi:hypothetical protein
MFVMLFYAHFFELRPGSDVHIEIGGKVVTVTGFGLNKDTLFAAVASTNFVAQNLDDPISADRIELPRTPVSSPDSDPTVVAVTSPPGAEPGNESGVRTTFLHVEGLRCMKNCGSKALAALQAVPNVTSS